MSEPLTLDNVEEDEAEKPDPRIKRPDLYIAARENDANSVITLLNEGVPPTHIDKTTGWTALHWASMHGNVKMTKRLLEHGASEPYHRFKKIDKEIKLRKSLKPKNGINGTGNENDASIIGSDETSNNSVHATEENDDDEQNDEDKLLEKRFNMIKNTPLLWATMKGHLSVVWLLLVDGYSPNDVDDLDNNMLHLAAAGGFIKILKVAIEDGGNIYALNIYHNYPKQLANTRDIYDILHNAQEETIAPLFERDIIERHEKTVSRVNIYIYIY